MGFTNLTLRTCCTVCKVSHVLSALLGRQLISYLAVFTLVLENVLLSFPPPPSFVPATLRRLALYDIEIRNSQTLLRHDVFPGLRSLAMGYNQVVVEARPDDDTEPADNALGERYRHLQMTDIPLLPQLRAMSIVRTPASLEGASIAVLDTQLFVLTPGTLPSTLQALRIVASYEMHPEPYLTELLNSHVDLPVFQELHLVGYAEEEENEETRAAWRGIRRWCAAQDVALLVSLPEELEDPSDPSFWRFLDSVQKRLGLDV